MTHTSSICASATATMVTTGAAPTSHLRNNGVTCGRCSLRRENLLPEHDKDAKRNLQAEERAVEKHWQPLFSSASHPLAYRAGKARLRDLPEGFLSEARMARRQVIVSASSLDWAVADKIQASNSNTTPYVVQKGDTLTSIAKKTKTSVRLLADANSIEDVDFLLSGQLLQIPTNPEGHEMPVRPAVGEDEFPIARMYDARLSSHKSVYEQGHNSKGAGVKAQSSRGIISPKLEGSQLAASVQPALSFNFPKLAVSILLVAPLLGFCIRCIVDALYIHIDRVEAKEQAERDAWDKLHSPKAKRWQKILEEDRDGVEEPSVSSPEGSTGRNAWSGGDVWTQDENVRENTKVQENIRNETDEEIGLRHKQDYEDIQKSYAELESVYVKFLADSGMSKSGYWRGSGVPTTARLDDGLFKFAREAGS